MEKHCGFILKNPYPHLIQNKEEARFSDKEVTACFISNAHYALGDITAAYQVSCKKQFKTLYCWTFLKKKKTNLQLHLTLGIKQTMKQSS